MSSNNAKLITDIIKSLNDPRIAPFKNEIGGKDVVFLFGNTRSGKSTLVNYLISTSLEAYEINRREYKIRKVNSSDYGPVIGEGSLSCTDSMQIFKVRGENKYIVDPPGFEDNRDDVKDIVNAFCFMMIKHAKSAKLAIVFDINELLSDNIRGFTKTLEYVQGLITNFKELKFCFIFTKDCRSYTPTDIIQLLDRKVLKVEGLNFTKTLVSNVVRDERFVGIFRMPENDRPLALELLDVNVKSALEFTAYADLQKCQIKYSVSDSALVVLKNCFLLYTDTMYFHKAINVLTEKLHSYFNVVKYVYASYDEELDYTLELVNKYISEFEKAKCSIETLEDVEKSLHILGNVAYSNFVSDFNFIVLMDKSNILDQKNRSIIVENYTNLLVKKIKRLSDLKTEIDHEKEDCSKTKLTFNGSIASSIIGSISLGAGIWQGIRTGGGIFGLIVGGLIAGTSIAVSVANYKELYINRIEERKKQGRDIK